MCENMALFLHLFEGTDCSRLHVSFFVRTVGSFMESFEPYDSLSLDSDLVVLRRVLNVQISCLIQSFSSTRTFRLDCKMLTIPNSLIGMPICSLFPRSFRRNFRLIQRDNRIPVRFSSREISAPYYGVHSLLDGLTSKYSLSSGYSRLFLGSLRKGFSSLRFPNKFSPKNFTQIFLDL